jgi:hypothetical protein
MNANKNVVPKWTRIVVGLLAFANIAFGVSNYFKFDSLFQNGINGIDLTGTGAKFASYEFGARNLGIGLALLIVAIVGIPETIAIMTIVRALIELQGVVIALVAGTFGSGAIVAIVMLCVEIFIIKTMFGIVAKRDAQ